MLIVAVTEVVQDVLQKDTAYEFLDIVNKYYNEEVQVLDFHRTGMQD